MFDLLISVVSTIADISNIAMLWITLYQVMKNRKSNRHAKG